MQDIENIIVELSAPVKTFRIFAIENAIKTGASPRLLEELKNCRAREDDPECIMLLEHAIASVSERLAQDTTKKPGAKKVTLAEFSKLDVKQQLQIVKLTGSGTFKNQGAAEGIRNLIKNSTHDVVKAEIVKKCWAFWPDDFSEFLENGLNSSSITLQHACLEAVINRSPETLQKHFDKLVTSADPVIRATAIRGLAKKYPRNAAIFLAESLRKGDYFARLAALRAVSIMPFNLNRISLLEFIAHEHDQRLLKIAAAIFLANPDREIPFRLADIIERTSSSRADFLRELQTNCCNMIRMAEVCPDFPSYLKTLKKYPNRLKARNFVESCLTTYSSTEDKATRLELVKLLRDKIETPEVAEAVDLALKQNNDSELLVLALKPAAKDEQIKTVSPSDKLAEAADKQSDILARLIRIRSKDKAKALETIKEAMQMTKAEPAILASAFRAAGFADDDRWTEKAAHTVKSDNEDLVAASIEYLANFANDEFLLHIRKFINSPSLIIRTALLRSLCRQNPEDARELLNSMLLDRDRRVREKAISSLIHFEFSSIREYLFNFLSREKELELIKMAMPFYLVNPLLESTYDLFSLSRQSIPAAKPASETLQNLKETLVELSMADRNEISNYLDKKEKSAQEQATVEEQREAERLAEMAKKMKWQSISEKFSELSEYYGVLKNVFLGGMLLAALFFFLAGSGDVNDVEPEKGFNPVASQIQVMDLTVQQVGLKDGAILTINQNQEKILVLPRPGKAFNVNPGARISIRAMPFRSNAEGVLIVKTIEVKLL